MTPHPPRTAATRDLVVAVSPFEEPHPRIVTAAERAGALGLLDLGRDPDATRRGFAALARGLGAGRRYGVRVPAGCPTRPRELAPEVDTVLLADPPGPPRSTTGYADTSSYSARSASKRAGA
ncbi:hypothetical protein AB0N28_25020, partial [Streptomyces sp. NPDC051130]|uniref:hypothetical protein n=1 Tax=Streptomyces sp. NPDC051130 TaxID=3157223 RepID=UPI0034263F75